MANSLPVAQQFALVRNFVRTRPTRALILVLLIVIGAIATQKYEPIVMRYSAHLAAPEREIETLLIVNPNIDKREVLLDLSQNGEVLDLGVDEAAAIDMSNKSPRLAKLSILERSVSVVTILRAQLEHGSVKVVSKSMEIMSTDSVMRRVAMFYLISLMLFLTGFISTISSLIGALTVLSNVFDRRELMEKVSKIFK
jgi:hypothetical protein